jgi:hypothetical protein
MTDEIHPCVLPSQNSARVFPVILVTAYLSRIYPSENDFIGYERGRTGYPAVNDRLLLLDVSFNREGIRI